MCQKAKTLNQTQGAHYLADFRPDRSWKMLCIAEKMISPVRSATKMLVFTCEFEKMKLPLMRGETPIGWLFRSWCFPLAGIFTCVHLAAVVPTTLRTTDLTGLLGSFEWKENSRPVRSFHKNAVARLENLKCVSLWSCTAIHQHWKVITRRCFS